MRERQSKSMIGFTAIAVLMLTLSGCSSFGGTKESTPFEKDERPVEDYIQAGDRAVKVGDLDEALVQYVLALEGGDKSVDTLYKIGTVHRLKNNLALAEAGYRNALEIEPGHLPSKEGLGKVYLRQEKLDLAEDLLKQVTESTDYQSSEAHSALGILYDLLGRYDEAELSYQAALALVPSSARYHNNLGYSYYLQGEYDLAKELYETSIGLDPGFSQAWANLALIHAKQGDQAQALSAFEQVGEKYQALNNLGYLNMLLGNDSNARKNLYDSVANSPSYYNTAYKNLDSLNMGKKEETLPGLLAPIPAREPVVESSALELNSDTDATLEVDSDDPPEDIASAREIEVQSNQFESDTALVLQVQQRLRFLGYDPGPTDGKYGSKTIRALRQFQENNGFVSDGKLTSAMIDALISTEFTDGQVPNG